MAPEDVRRLDVAMDDAACRRVSQTPSGLVNHSNHLGHGERTTHPHVLVQIEFIHALKYRVVAAAVDTAIVDRSDIGVLQHLGTTRSAQEPPQHDPVSSLGRRQHPEHNPVTGLDVDCFVDRAHSPEPSGCNTW